MFRGARSYRAFTGPRYSKLGNYNNYRRAVSSEASYYNRTKRYQSKAPSKKGTIYQQLKSLQQVVQAQRPEQKFVDVSVQATNFDDSVGAVVLLNQVAQGDTQTTRTGEFINITGIHVKGIWIRGADAISAQGHVQCVIVQDLQHTQATSPSGLDIMSTGDPTLNFPAVSDNAERFKFLYVGPVVSTQMMLLGDVTEAIVPTRDTFVEFKWSGNIRAAYFDTGATNVAKNPIYMGFYTNDTGDFTDFNGAARISFTDA